MHQMMDFKSAEASGPRMTLRGCAQLYPLNTPVESLNSPRPCGVSVLAAPPGAAVAVGDALLPHNSRTVVETGSARSPVWNSERNTGSLDVCAEATCMGAAIGV